MNSPQEKKVKNIVRELKSISQERNAYLLGERKLFLKEGLLWDDLKETGIFRSTHSNRDTSKKIFPQYVQKMGYSYQTVQERRIASKKWIKEMGYSIEELSNFNPTQLYRSTPYVHSKKDAEKILKKARGLDVKAFLKWLKKTYSK